MSHPYRHLPDKSFWSRSVSEEFRAVAVVSSDGAILREGDRVVSVGSCFAANLVPYLEAAGFEYIRKEMTEAVFDELGGEALSYSKFSAACGNIYTTRQLLQLWERSLGRWSPDEDRWIRHDEVIDPFRPGLKYRARSEREFDLITDQHLAAVRAAFTSCDVFIFTLGLTEAWQSTADGAVFPACPGTIAGEFDESRYEFVNFGVDEIAQDMERFITSLREHNPSVRVILTVSPVPLVATATGQHVLAATTYSKSVLRVAAERVTQSLSNVLYFPAYEIVTGPQAPWESFETDRRSVSEDAIREVMQAFLSHCEGAEISNPSKITTGRTSLNQTLVHIECEEAGQEL